ncbi:1,5-anhydro-D-fructose reductase-like isoform X1 [Pecten maximus]|uniref:1,5-anhydro-D-fructose reductase-like isoform X1 n=1 Tax=Pecten maximus TaxID=6579 RepID=UPI001458882A|nr:1,5-anhydro-D-fructose reductase-like isoform X1 [Pecten maximus]
MAEKFCIKLQSGNVMPVIGLGTYAPKQGEDEVISAVKVGVRAGYRHLDCAAIYRNERAVGHAIKELIIEDTIKREDLFVTSKLWNTCHRPDLVRSSLKKSLYDLGLTYLDLYLIHWPMGLQEGGEFLPKDEDGTVLFSDVDFVETWKALEDCVDEGLVRDIGLSNFNSQQISQILDIARIRPSNNQIEIHLHLANSKLIQFCQENSISVTAYSPLGSPGNKAAYQSVPFSQSLQEAVVLDIAQKKGKTPAQVILRFLLQKNVCVIPKSVTPARVIENFQIFDFELDSDEVKQLENLNKNHRLNLETHSMKHKYYPFNIEY